MKKYIITLSMESSFGDEGREQVFTIEAADLDQAQGIADRLEKHLEFSGAYSNYVTPLEKFIEDHSQLSKLPEGFAV